MPSIGPLELIVLLVIVLLIFGPKRLPGLGRQLGTGMREFKDSITGKDKGGADEVEQPVDDERPRQRAVGPSQDEPVPAAPAPQAAPAEGERPRQDAPPDAG